MGLTSGQNDPLFWSSTNASPKRQFRFYVSFGSAPQSINIPLWTVKTATKPKATVAVTEHAFLNHTFKYPGRVTWDNVTVTLTDPEDINVCKQVVNLLTKSGYETPGASTTIKAGQGKTISKEKAVSAIGSVLIRQTGADGAIVDTWKLVNPWVVSMDFGGTMDYSSDDLTEITMEIAFDYALYGAGSKLPVETIQASLV